MARLPTKDDLSDPVSLRSGRAIASFDTTGLGRGISSAGASLESLGNEINQQQNAVDIARAEAYKTEQFLGVQNDFDADPDYATYDERAPKRTKEVIDNGANLIRDPKMRERWKFSAQADAARVNDNIHDKGFTLKRQSEVNAFDEALEANRRLYVDPNTPELAREKAKADIEASIKAAEGTGLLTPDEAQKRRDVFIDGADYSRGQLAVERDPYIIATPLPPKVADRASVAMRYYQSRGWTKEQAAGIVGNLLAESKLNTGAVNPGDGADGSNSVGIAQWNSDRVDRLKDFAAQNKADWRDFGVQLAFVDHELRTSETTAGNALKNAKNIDEATAAFAGYERPQGWSAANPRAAHNYRGRLNFAAQAAGENINPEWFDRLSPEQQQALYDRSAKRESEITRDLAAQQKAQYEAYKDSVGLSILTGGVSSEQEILSDSVLNDGDKATLLRSFRTEMKDQLATATAIQQFASGDLRVDPYDTEGRKTVDNVYDAAVKAAPENIRPITEEIVRQTGAVPKGALNLIRQGMTSTDVNAVMEAAQAAQRISTINPAALSRREGGTEVQRMADDFSFYVNNLNLSPEEAARRIQEAQDPAKQRDRKALEPAAKEFLKGIDDFNLAGQFDESFLGLMSDPALGFDEGQRLGMMAEFKAIAEDQFYRSNGDPEIAKNRAVEQMKRLYGVTSLTGTPTVIKHPPERYWPAFRIEQLGETSFIGNDPSLDYATIQLQADLEQLYPGVDMDRVQLITTPGTDRMVKRGEMPGYAVVYKDEDGVLQTIPGQLWRPDVRAAQQRQTPIEAREQAEREAEARRQQGINRGQITRQEILNQREREAGQRMRGETVTPAPQRTPADPAQELPDDQLPTDGDVFEGAMP